MPALTTIKKKKKRKKKRYLATTVKQKGKPAYKSVTHCPQLKTHSPKNFINRCTSPNNTHKLEQICFRCCPLLSRKDKAKTACIICCLLRNNKNRPK